MDKIPVLAPLKNLLFSRKFLVGLGALAVDTLIVAVPELEPLRGDFMTLVAVVAGIVIAAIALEDAAEKHAG